ncbi:MAG: type II toxin-antitoxin system RelE/ParE family toxin [Microthrixaceae bacterium]
MQVTIRELAAADIDAAVAYYRSEATTAVAYDFVKSLEAAVGHLQKHPLTGSLRFAFELGIPNLRSWPLAKFPYLIFYVPAGSQTDIWRVLHAKRDIPTFLAPNPNVAPLV